MNVMIAQSSISRNEIWGLGNPGIFFISYKNGRPKAGESQDSLIGTSELTRSNVRIDKYHMMQLIGQTSATIDLSGRPNQIKNGRYLLSMLLQEKNLNINFSTTANIYQQGYAPFMKYDPQEIKVQIDRGKIKSGVIDSKTIGEGAAGGLFHIIHNKYGAEAALSASHDIQQLALAFLFYRGFTVSMEDLVLDKKHIQKIHEIESSLVKGSHLITKELNDGYIIPPIGSTIQEFYEEKQLNQLSSGDLFIGPVLNSIDPTNNGFSKLIMTGSKGKPVNLWSSVSAIGQLTIGGERMKEDFGGRTLPYFTRYDNNPISRGYIANSYSAGIINTEFIANAQEARNSLIGIAMGTAVSGEQNRKSIKNLEPIAINNRRQASKFKNILQPIYGDDGADPRYLEMITIPTMAKNLSDKKFAELYHSKAKDFPEFNRKELQNILDKEFAILKQDRDLYRRIFLDIEAKTGRLFTNKIHLPINVKRIIDDVIYQMRDTETSTVDPIQSLEMIQNLTDNLPYRLMNEIMESKKIEIPKYMEHAMTLLRILIRSYLNVATLVKHSISSKMLKIIIDRIKFDYSQSLIDYGVAIGIISAQAVSEPMTQMALDSKHRAGLGGAKVKGMSKIKEIFGARPTERMTSPTMILQVIEEFKYNKAKVREIANHIEMLPFNTFVISWQLFFEEYGKPIHPDYTKETALIKEYEKFNKGVQIPTDLSKWVLRFELSRSNMILKQMDIETIYTKIRTNFPQSFIIYSQENAPSMTKSSNTKKNKNQEHSLVMRVYFRTTFTKTFLDQDKMLEIKDNILNTIIRGVDGIIAANVREASINVIAPSGEIETKQIYSIVTDGTNFQKILENSNIDPNTIQSDSILEIAEMLGIEAAREKIINELRNQVDSVSYKHYPIYADEMCYTGVVTSIERHGLSKRERHNFMLRISESSPINVMEDGAVNNMLDNLEGISPRIMMGESPRIGSLYNSFIIDEEFVKSNTQNVDDVLAELF